MQPAETGRMQRSDARSHRGQRARTGSIESIWAKLRADHRASMSQSSGVDHNARPKKWKASARKVRHPEVAKPSGLFKRDVRMTRGVCRCLRLMAGRRQWGLGVCLTTAPPWPRPAPPLRRKSAPAPSLPGRWRRWDGCRPESIPRPCGCAAWRNRCAPSAR
jgi:hypothetical protein